MAKKTYAEKLKDPRWQKKRLKIMNRDRFKCATCGDYETTLCIHHLKYSGEPWEAEDSDLITLCEHCHLEIEKEKSNYDLDIKKLKIYKSDRWKSGARIMFMPIGSNLGMSIYDSSGSFIIGFNLNGYDIKKIKSIEKYLIPY